MSSSNKNLIDGISMYTSVTANYTFDTPKVYLFPALPPKSFVPPPSVILNPRLEITVKSTDEQCEDELVIFDYDPELEKSSRDFNGWKERNSRQLKEYNCVSEFIPNCSCGAVCKFKQKYFKTQRMAEFSMDKIIRDGAAATDFVENALEKLNSREIDLYIHLNPDEQCDNEEVQIVLDCGCDLVCNPEKRLILAQHKLDEFMDGESKICAKYDYEPDQLIEDLNDARDDFDSHLMTIKKISIVKSD